jgi:hypothetical protein
LDEQQGGNAEVVRMSSDKRTKKGYDPKRAKR